MRPIGETVGPISLYLDEESRDIVLAIKTDIGVVSTSLMVEQATRLGIELIRESGKRYVTKPEKERKNEIPTKPDPVDPASPVDLYSSARQRRNGGRSYGPDSSFLGPVDGEPAQ